MHRTRRTNSTLITTESQDIRSGPPKGICAIDFSNQRKLPQIDVTAILDVSRTTCIQTTMFRLTTLASSLAFAAAFLLVGSTGCSNQPSNPQQVREATAKATAEVKNDVKAAAEGVRDGLRSPSSSQPLDLNSAPKNQLTALHGIDDRTADRIIDHRPYTSARQLVERGLISREEYDQIADRITVR